MTSTWRFRALDTLFFRDSRPHGGAGAAILGSLFPPSPRTVAGAVRFLLGNALGADWSAFGRALPDQGFDAGGRDLLRLIGRHDDYGALRFAGPWLAVRTAGESWRRLYPAPRALTCDETGRPAAWLRIGPRVECDLGDVHLPTAPEHGQRSAERLWLEASAYAEAMAGGVPDAGIYPAGSLFEIEPRLGIARDLDRHTAADGMLFQTRHVRPRDAVNGERDRPERAAVREVAIEIAVTCGEEPPPDLARLVRLGGEGRLAGVDVVPGDAEIPPAPKPSPDASGLVLALLTPVELGGSWLPPGFAADRRDGRATAWRGELAGVPLTVHSAAIGPALREGGWDLAARQPRPVRSLVPAGSAWYATVHDASGRTLTGEALEPAIGVLHGARLADDALGHGQLAVGLFDDTRFPDLEVSR